MKNFSTNQVRQVYVIKSVSAVTPAAEGAAQILKSKDQSEVILKYMGVKGLQSSDILKKGQVMSVNTLASDDVKAFKEQKSVTVKLRSDIEGFEVVVGQEYILKVVVRQAYTNDEGSSVPFYGSYFAKAGDDASKVMSEVAASLTKNFGDKVALVATADADAVTVAVKEGVVEPILFFAEALPVVFNGDEMPWFYADSNDEKSGYTEVYNALGVTHGDQIAELEKFAMGERGDQYRMWSYPNVIETKYLFDPSKDYKIVTAHFYFVNATGLKSEKDIQVVLQDAALNDTTIEAAFKALIG